MIQRIQSLYLSGVLILGLLVFFFNPSYAVFKDSGSKLVVKLGYTKSTFIASGGATTTQSKYINFLLLLTISLGAGAAIFLYKKTALQKKVCIYLTLLSALLLLLMFLEYQEQAGKLSGTLGVGVVFPFIFMAATFLAWKDIRRDETLLQSMDRIR